MIKITYESTYDDEFDSPFKKEVIFSFDEYPQWIGQMKIFAELLNNLPDDYNFRIDEDIISKHLVNAGMDMSRRVIQEVQEEKEAEA